MATIDATHVLVATEPKFEATGALYSYDLNSGTLRAIVTQMPGNKPIFTNRWAVSDHFVVWAIDGTSGSNVFKHGFDVYAAPLSGGTARFVAHIDGRSPDTSPWYATDNAVYWSDASAAGVFALPLAGGTPAPVPGFADMRVVDASGWTVRSARAAGGDFVTTALKQLVTGRTRQVATSPAMFSLSCTPTFCIGQYGHRDEPVGDPFIQDLDGGHRMTVPKAFATTLVSVYVNGDSGLVIGDPSQGGLTIQVWDPFTGAAGSLIPVEDAQHSLGASQVHDVYGFHNGKTGVWTYLALGAIR